MHPEQKPQRSRHDRVFPGSLIRECVRTPGFGKEMELNGVATASRTGENWVAERETGPGPGSSCSSPDLLGFTAAPAWSEAGGRTEGRTFGRSATRTDEWTHSEASQLEGRGFNNERRAENHSVAKNPFCTAGCRAGDWGAGGG